MSYRIFIVDDEIRLIDMLCRFFWAKGHIPLGNHNGDINSIISFRPDIVLLDWHLQGPRCGESILMQLRESELSDIPIIFMSGQCDIGDRVRVLTAGADDYLTKPFELSELEARVTAVIRRAQKPNHVFKDHRLEINPEKRRLLVKGEVRTLSRTEWDLLVALLNSSGAQTRSKLAMSLWGEGSDINHRTIDRLVVNIRRAIETDPKRPVYLLSERGRGYRIALGED
jgi:two-component system KDP operon response regulator KdpE